MPRRIFAIVLSSLFGCGPAVGDGDGGSEGGTGGSSTATGPTTSASASSVTATSSTSSSTADADTTGVTIATTSNDDNDDDDSGPICILHHHETAIPGTCQSDRGCCPGEKCVPSPALYSECVPLEDAPAGIGEPCVRRGILDDCEAGAVCRGLDPKTGEGRCVEFCDLGHSCDANDVVCTQYPLELCLPTCDPLAPACPGTDGCLPMRVPEVFACVPDELPSTSGVAGDPCSAGGVQDFSGCDPNHLCAPDIQVAIAACADDFDDGCCTRLCAVADAQACMGIGVEICEPMSTLVGEPWPDALGVGFCR